MVHAILVTHPNQNFTAIISGLELNKLKLLHEFRYSISKAVKKRFKIIEAENEMKLNAKISELRKKSESYLNKMTKEMYEHEIKGYFEIN
jgi:hypothetical protein